MLLQLETTCVFKPQVYQNSHSTTVIYYWDTPDCPTYPLKTHYRKKKPTKQTSKKLQRSLQGKDLLTGSSLDTSAVNRIDSKQRSDGLAA